MNSWEIKRKDQVKLKPCKTNSQELKINWIKLNGIKRSVKFLLKESKAIKLFMIKGSLTSNNNFPI